MRPSKQKSRTFRRVFKKITGNKIKLHYVRRKPAKAKCSECGVFLKGVARELPKKMKNMAKTKKRPSRPFGGVLCSKCSRKKIKEMNR
jgi:large subunit ribosomal protein L34e